MHDAHYYEKYREQAVSTQTPGELIVLLYDRAIFHMGAAARAIEQKPADAHNGIRRAQEIVRYLRGVLDCRYPVSRVLGAYYDKVISQLSKANVRKDPAKLEDALNSMRTLRDTWKQVEAQNHRPPAAGKRAVTRDRLAAVASEKLNLLTILHAALFAFVSDEQDPDAAQIASVFQKCDDIMAHLKKLDAQYAAVSQTVDAEKPEPAGNAALRVLLADQRALALRVTDLIRQAEEKAARLSRDCRNALHAITRKKWICAQLKDRTPKPGSLLEYSEKLGVPRGER